MSRDKTADIISNQRRPGRQLFFWDGGRRAAPQQARQLYPDQTPGIRSCSHRPEQPEPGLGLDREYLFHGIPEEIIGEAIENAKSA